MKDSSNKNGIGKTIIIILLLVVILGLIFYICYDKGLILNNKEEVEKENTETDNEESKEIKNTINKLTEQEALALGKEMWKYAYSTYWGTEPTWKTHLGDKNEYGGVQKICDTTIEEVKQKYTSDFKAREHCSLEDKSQCLEDTVDEFIGSNPCGGHARGGDQFHKETNLEIKSIEENKIIFKAISSYCDTSFCQDYTNITHHVEDEFIITKQNDTWLISYFYLPN